MKFQNSENAPKKYWNWFPLSQVPGKGLLQYASQVLSAIVALIEDTEEEVAFEAVRGLETVSFFQGLEFQCHNLLQV